MRPLALSDSELAALMDAARALQPEQRDVFLRALAFRVQDTREIDLGRVCADVLRELLRAPEARRPTRWVRKGDSVRA